MKKFLIPLVCLAMLSGVAATIQWFHQQPAGTPVDTDIMLAERQSANGYIYFPMSTLRAYVGTNSTYLYTTNLTVYSNAYFFETNFIGYTFTTNLTVVNNSYLSNVYVTNLYSEFITNNYLFTTNVTAQYITNNYLYSTNITAKNLTVQNNFYSATNRLGDVVVTNGITNLSLTADTVLKADANQRIVSIPNGSGSLTNDGSGNVGWAATAAASPQVWTNDGDYIFFSGNPSPSTTGATPGPPMFVRKDGSLFLGTNVSLDVYQVDSIDNYGTYFPFFQCTVTSLGEPGSVKWNIGSIDDPNTGLSESLMSGGFENNGTNNYLFMNFVAADTNGHFYALNIGDANRQTFLSGGTNQGSFSWFIDDRGIYTGDGFIDTSGPSNSTSVAVSGPDGRVTWTNAPTFTGPASSLSTTTNGPANNELVTAGWVRGLFNVGAAYYASTNIDIGATNPAQANQTVYTFEGAIPVSFVRGYATTDFLTNNGYIGSVVTTNSFPSLAGNIVVNAYLGFAGGASTPSLTVHPEIYYSYDKTNWLGDYSGANQTIVYNATNLYQWAIDFPAYTATNANGFYIQRRFKVGTVTGTGTRTLYFLGGTNIYSGVNDASHITMQSPTATAGNAYLANNQTFTATNNFSARVDVNNLAVTNGIFRLITAWAGPTNGLNCSVNYQAYETYVPCDITNFTGGGAGFATDAALSISNASASNITLYITAANTKNGDYVTSYTITNGDVLDLSVQNINGAWTKTLARGFH